jgi:spore germination protein KA
MLRRIVNNEDLIIENSNVGKITKTKIAICYMKNITNNDLIAEVKFRINNLNVDYLFSSGQLEQLIQDSGNSMFPQILATERPDKAAINLLEGRVIVLVNGSPFCLIMPAVLVDFLSSPEDLNLKYQFSNLLKIVRMIAAFLALLLPGLYVAITSYHHELIPTELLFAIATSREAVPFPVIIEILVMEISFELLREAGLRVPSPIGPTIGIVRSFNSRRSGC